MIYQTACVGKENVICDPDTDATFDGSQDSVSMRKIPALFSG